jgi:hypothetical protein
MTRCRCWNAKTHKPKHMRLRSDGWKRCNKCGMERPGLALIAQWGRERMEREGWANLPSQAVPAPTTPNDPLPRRLPVKWKSSGPLEASA